MRPAIFYGPGELADHCWRVEHYAIVRLYGPALKAAEAFGIDESDYRLDMLIERVGKLALFRCFLEAVEMFEAGEAVYVPDAAGDDDLAFLEAIGAIPYTK